MFTSTAATLWSGHLIKVRIKITTTQPNMIFSLGDLLIKIREKT
jgi:hypothetical protein